MDTPIFDGVLGDRLQQARAAADRAEAGARAFTAALTAGDATALEHLAAARAERIVGARTALLTARVTALESEVRTLRDQAVRVAAEAEAEPGRATPAPAPAPPAAPSAPAAAPAARPEAAPAAARAPAAPSEVPGRVKATPPPPDAAVAGRSPRKGADQGPTGEDVPVVPSMKDIFASSRAAGWLDSLLGAKR